MSNPICDFSDLPADTCGHCVTAPTGSAGGESPAQKVNDVRREALQLMADHGLLDAGWVFAFDNAKGRVGLCSYTKRRISVSKHWAEVLPFDTIRNTLLHEVAHALVGPGHHHNWVWRRQAIAIGCTGTRCTDVGDERLETSWLGTCPSCGNTSKGHRSPQRVKACGKCCRGRFNPKYIMTWTTNGRPAKMGAKYMREYNAIMQDVAKDAIQAELAVR